MLRVKCQIRIENKFTRCLVICVIKLLPVTVMRSSWWMVISGGHSIKCGYI